MSNEVELHDITNAQWAALRALQLTAWPRRLHSIGDGSGTMRAHLMDLVALGLATVETDRLPSFQWPPPGPEESWDLTPLGVELLACRHGFMHPVDGCNGHTDWVAQDELEAGTASWAVSASGRHPRRRLNGVGPEHTGFASGGVIPSGRGLVTVRGGDYVVPARDLPAVNVEVRLR